MLLNETIMYLKEKYKEKEIPEQINSNAIEIVSKQFNINKEWWEDLEFKYVKIPVDKKLDLITFRCNIMGKR